MRLLDRYLLRELLIPLGYCLSGFLILWVAQDMIGELSGFQSRKLLLSDIAEYYLVKAPEFIVLILPMGLLLALLYTLTNHSRHNEITAIRSAGISVWRLCVPYLAVGLLATAASFALNELCVPNSGDIAEQIRTRRLPLSQNTGGRNQIINQGFDNKRDDRLWHFGSYHLKTTEMLVPVVISKRGDGSRRWLKADRAVRTNGVWSFFNARLYDETGSNSPPVLVLKTNLLAMPQFTETPDEIRSELRISAMLNTLLLKGVKRADIPVTQLLTYLKLHPHPNQAAALYTKLQGRLATPWTCLVVVLIATPFGAASGRRNVFVGVASSILIFFVYYVLQQLCLALGAGGTLPAWLAGWGPNLAFALVGLWLMARIR
ncbi:MAG TPA: LptF/LptG family permease [Candidatus Limnocylindrales bacterium]|jgi:LPS export ABC transporter permease LptG|nr:LptF/LptG family permease [Candidatus Limnocylindrales bacterium]